MDNQIQPNIPPIQPQIQTPVSSPPNLGKALLFTLLGLVIVAGSVFAGIQIGKKQIVKQRTITEQPTILPTQTVVNQIIIPSVTPSLIDTQKYIKRLFDKSTKLIGDINFPTELTNFTDNQLIGLSCSPNYLNDYQGKYLTIPTQDNEKQIELTDQQLIALTKTNPKITVISKCFTETGVIIIHYEIHIGGGGSENTVYFGILNQSNSINEIVNIPNDGTAYFECREPYLLNKTNILYWGCGGGDGPASSKSIYAINLTDKTFQKILKCTSVSSNYIPTGTNPINCE